VPSSEGAAERDASCRGVLLDHEHVHADVLGSFLSHAPLSPSQAVGPTLPEGPGQSKRVCSAEFKTVEWIHT